jgi:hypothetical protein
VDLGSVRKKKRILRSLRAAGPVLAVTGPTWRQLVEQGWSILPEFTFAGEENPLEGVGKARLLHLMGRCTLTTAGLRLQVSGTGATVLSKMANDSSRRGLLLSSAEVYKSIHYGLVVVQGDPAPPESVRFDTERQETGNLRAFAAEIFSAGVPAVLLLPSLPPDLAASLLEMIANEFNLRSSSRWNTWERPQDDPLIDLASRLRQRIAEWRPDTDSGEQTQAAFSQAETSVPSDASPGLGATRELPAVMLEKALDLTLFLRDEGNFF